MFSQVKIHSINGAGNKIEGGDDIEMGQNGGGFPEGGM